jgi:hypothetical protein
MLDLHAFKAPSNSIILCADVTALYPNIPIDLGIRTVTRVLKDLKCFTDIHLAFLMELLAFILTENYCSFNDVIYHQLKGTAMGTPTAVSYSNIFLFGIEHGILFGFYHHSYFTRYIDDVFAIFASIPLGQSFIDSFNAFCPSITFEAVTLDRTGIMLDLEISLVATPTHDKITHKIYQKERNIYQYIPTLSEHKSSLFENFVTQELTRYKLACTSHIDYGTITTAFATRLAARGYPSSIIQEALPKIPTRYALMHRLRTTAPVSTKYTRGNPIISLCIPRLEPRIPWATILHIPDAISTHHSYVNNFISGRVLIGSRNPPKIGSYLVRSKFTDPH